MLKKKAIDPFEEELKDLGFGSRITSRSGSRLLNQDGSFNVERVGVPFYRSMSSFHSLLTMPWWKFNLTVLASFIGINAVFGFAYLMAGSGIIDGSVARSIPQKFLDSFFFSVQTFTTVGYGDLSPHGLAGNIIATLDVFVGLFAFAFATGLLFARFSRPTAKILFSKKAIFSPYRDGTAFEFRIANERRNQLIEVGARVLYSHMDIINGQRIRRFHELVLERAKVAFLPLHLTVVHPVDENSPLYGLTMEQLADMEAEFLILITAVDETFSQNVHARSSYRVDEIVWDARFSDMFHYPESGVVTVDMRRLHKIEPVTARKD